MTVSQLRLKCLLKILAACTVWQISLLRASALVFTSKAANDGRRRYNRSLPQPQCIQQAGVKLLAVTSCPLNWNDSDTRVKCLKQHGLRLLDFTTYMYVYSNKTNRFYTNAFCANCNDDVNDLISFDFDFRCEGNSSFARSMKWADQEFFRSATYHRPTSTWNLEFQGQRLTCSLYPKNLTELEQNFPFHLCHERGILGAPNEPIFNVHLRNIGKLIFSGRNEVCKEFQINDPNTNKYFQLACPRRYTRSKNGRCVELPDSSYLKERRNSFRKNCEGVRSTNMTKVDNKIYDNNTDICFKSGEFDFRYILRSMDVCSSEGIEPLPKELRSHEMLFCSIFLFISILFLILRLMSYIPHKCSSHFGKLQISVTFTLLIAQICYGIAMLTAANRDDPICYGAAVGSHYFYLASFFWMNVILHDIWSVLCTVHYCYRGLRRWIYCNIYAWGSPMGIIAIALIMDTFLDDYERSPMYGLKMCWISDQKAFLLFFFLPVFVLTFINSIWYLMIITYLWKTKKLQRDLEIENDSINLRVYMKLAMSMGITWLLLFVTSFKQLTILNNVFFVLNGLHGILIYRASKKTGVSLFSASWSFIYQRSRSVLNVFKA